MTGEAEETCRALPRRISLYAIGAPMKYSKLIIFCIIAPIGCVGHQTWHAQKPSLTLTSSGGSALSEHGQDAQQVGGSVGIRILERRRSTDSAIQSGKHGYDSPNSSADTDRPSQLRFSSGKISQTEDTQPTDSLEFRALEFRALGGFRPVQPAEKPLPDPSVRFTAVEEEALLPALPGTQAQPRRSTPVGLPSALPVLPEHLPAAPAEQADPKPSEAFAEPAASPAPRDGVSALQPPESQPSGLEPPGPWPPGSQPADSQPPGTQPPGTQPAPVLPRPPAVAAAEVHQSTEGVPLEQLLTYALQHHPLLKARHHEIEIAQARLITAGLLPNPQFVLDTETPTRTIDDTSLTTRLVFTFPLGNKRNLAQRAAQAAIERAQHRLSRETESVLAAAAMGAVDVLYYQELAHLRAQLAGHAAWRAEVERARFELQAGSLADKMTAEVDAADARIQQLDAEARLEAARIRLSQLVGLTPPRPLAVQGRLAAPPIQIVPLEVVIAQAVTVRPELAETRAAVQESQWRVALARASAIPDLDIGPRFQTDIGAWKDRVGARIGFDLPIFDRKQGDIAEQQALLRTNCALRDLSELNSLSDVAAAYCELVPLRATLDYYENEVLPSAQRAEEALLKAYEAKAIQPIELSDLQRKLGRMRLGYLEMRHRYNQLLIRLELFLGRKLSDLGQPQKGAIVPTK